MPQGTKATRRVPYRFVFSHWFPRVVSTLNCTDYLPAAVLTLSIDTTVVLPLSSLERSVLAGALLSFYYCCRLSIDVLVGAEALYVPGLTALMARSGVFQISRVTSLVHSALNCAWVAVGDTYRRAYVLVGACECRTRVCMYVCMVITYSRVWINRVRLPILLVVS